MRKGTEKPLMHRPSIVVVDNTQKPAKKKRRLGTRRPVDEWRQPHCNMRAADFHDGPEPGDLN